MKKILVTGCNGFLGRHICAAFSARGNAVSGIDVAGTPEAALAGFILGTVTPEALKQLGEPFDVIIHLAGPGTVSAANLDAEAIRKSVQENMHVILESTRSFPDTLLLYPSSAAVYGDQKRTPIPEDAELAPLSHYGCNKVEAEKLCEEYHQRYGSRIGIIRFFSIFGPGLRKQLLWDFSQRLAAALKEGKDFVPCFGTGEESRDYIYIDDVVRIFEFFCRKNLDWLVVNAGNGISHSVRQVLEQLLAAYGVSMKLEFDGICRQGNPFHLIADTENLEKSGFNPKVSFETGLARYASWAAKELSM